MINSNPIFKDEIDWKGNIHILELFDSTNFSGLSPIKQVQAVCFDGNDNIVLYKHSDNYFGLPGGTVENGEMENEALKRELYEEASVKVIDYGPIGYIKSYPKEQPEKFIFQLRYWAKVKLLDETPDPDNKAIERVLTPIVKVSEKLGWGKMGVILIDLAKKKAGFVN